MKKPPIIVMAVLALLLTACGTSETMETVADEILQPVSAEMRQIYLELPSEAASPTVESGSDRLYQCETYEIYVQTLAAGDLNATIQTLSGYGRDALTVMQTRKDGYDCYRFVWASAGESGDMVGQGMILSDSSYHYCVSVLGDADRAVENQIHWDSLFDSFTLA